MEDKERLQEKHRIFQALLEKKKSEHEDLTGFQRSHLESVNKDDLDKGDMIESPTENLMREVRLEGKSIQNLEEEIELLSEYESSGLKDKIADMTIIRTSIGNFVVCVPEHLFEVNGEKYTGISLQSPIYEALENRKKGDKILFNGQDIYIREVL